MKTTGLIFALALSGTSLGCSTTIDAPSLAPRAAEKPDPAPAPIAAPVVDPAQVARIAGLIDRARQADVAFERALPAAATNAAPGSDAWIAAQNARSAVEVARGPMIDVIAALDTALGAALDTGRDTAALTAARADVQAMYDRQTARLDALNR